MVRMILYCGACSAQNFVSEERRAAANAPPVCWKCGAVLAPPAETGPDGEESKRDGDTSGETGDGRDV